MAIQMMFAAILSSGTIGVADQYLCLFLLSMASQFNLVQLPAEVHFMASVWFLIIIGVIWVATVLPAYGSLIDPIVLRVVNTTVGLVSGVLTPASGALLALATAYFVAPSTMAHASSSNLWVIGGGGAALASTLSFAKFMIKPMIATATGMAATTISPAVYKTVENGLSLVMMAAIYFLGSINPWVLVAFMVVVAVLFLTIIVFTIYQLWKMKQGIGKVLRLFKTNPKAGFALVLETFVWGSGWVLMKGWRAGAFKLVLFALSAAVIWFFLPVIFIFIGPISAVIPFIASIAVIYLIGLSSSRKLLKTIEGNTPSRPPVPASTL